MLSLVIMKHPQKISCLILDAIFTLPCAHLTISIYYNENFSNYYELWLIQTFTLP